MLSSDVAHARLLQPTDQQRNRHGQRQRRPTGEGLRVIAPHPVPRPHQRGRLIVSRVVMPSLPQRRPMACGSRPQLAAQLGQAQAVETLAQGLIVPEASSGACRRAVRVSLNRSPQASTASRSYITNNAIGHGLHAVDLLDLAHQPGLLADRPAPRA